MIGEKALTYAVTPTSDTKSISAEILPEFAKKGLGRMVILRDPTKAGVGVIHDGKLQAFLLDQVKAGTDLDDVTLKDLLGDPTLGKLLQTSAIYVSPTTTLAEVKQRMEDASKGRESAVRDAFVTATGAATDKVIGYVTDVDLAKKGAFK
jgi:hypothetical protein